MERRPAPWVPSATRRRGMLSQPDLTAISHRCDDYHAMYDTLKLSASLGTSLASNFLKVAHGRLQAFAGKGPVGRVTQQGSPYHVSVSDLVCCIAATSMANRN